MLKFRTATPDDIGAMLALVESAYRGEASRAGWTTEADLLEGQRTDREELGELMDRPRSMFLLGEFEGRLAASVHLAARGEVCHLGMFAVTPARQGRGIGKALLTESERRARADWDCQSMEMRVITRREELIAWYERRGYRRTGAQEPFPYGNPRFGLPRRPDLRLEVLRKDI